MLAEWQTVSELPPLEANELHLWRIDLAAATLPESVYLQRISTEERSRAARLREGEVRMQFIVARSALRTLLGSHLALDPIAVQIALGSHGKPDVAGPGNISLSFNLAHSRSTIVIALCRDCRVGVDLEYLDRDTDMDEVARQAFTVSEYRAIATIHDPIVRRRAFFNCWTRKEAVIKAEGRGLSLPLTAFEVPVFNPVSSALVEVARSELLELPHAEDTNWPDDSFYISDLPLGDHIAGAVALDHPEFATRLFNFPLDTL